MLPRADLNVTAIARTEPVVRTDSIGDARHEAFQRTMAGLLGQSLQGKIVSKLTDGSYLVELAGASARMLLPAGTQVGSQLPMTLVALTPRPTFQLSPPGATPSFAHADAVPPALAQGMASSLAVPPDLAQARAAALAQGNPGAPAVPGQPGGAAAAGVQAGAAQLASQAGAAQAAALSGQAAADAAAFAQTGSAQTILSPTAKVLSNVLSLAMSAPNTPNGIVAAAPLAPAPGAAPAQLAAALQDSVARSGLFYESHVAEWAAGRRPLAELATEPQMQRAFAGAVPTEDTAAAQLVNLQLQTQEQARVVWQGQVWPGQDMHWEVQRDERDAADDARPDGEAAEPGWRSSLHLRFPLLGEIGARLYMSGDQVHLQLDAGDSKVGELLRERSGELGAAMEAAGISLSSFNIRAAQAGVPGDE